MEVKELLLKINKYAEKHVKDNKELRFGISLCIENDGSGILVPNAYEKFATSSPLIEFDSIEELLEKIDNE